MKTVLQSSLIFFLCAFTSYSQERSLGMKIDREKAQDVPLISKPFGFGDNLPEAVSLKEYVPKIENQGEYGTCVGWSSTYYLATMEYAIQSGKYHEKELEYFAYDPFFTYLSIVDGDSYSTCGDGTFVEDACELLKKEGAKRKYMNSLSCGDELKGHSESNSILDFTEFHRLYDWEDDMEDNVVAVCQSLADNHPVVFGALLPRSFFKIEEDGLFKPTNLEKKDPVEQALGGHAMCIVGYDDNKFGGCFIIVNSWGDEWGDQGYLYMTYADYQIFGLTAYSFETSLKKPYSVKPGTVFGSTYSGYGIKRSKGGGIFEGEFVNGEMSKGVYFNHSGKKFRGGTNFMNKMVKKHGVDLIFDDTDPNTPIGFILD